MPNVQIPGMYDDFQGMLTNSPNLYNQEIGTWMNNMSSLQSEYLARALASRQAQAAASNPAANEEFLRNLNALGIVRETPQVQEPAGFWSQVWNRGVDQLQSDLYGMAGLFGDLISSDAIRDWGIEGFLANKAELENTPTPRQVPNIESIGSMGDFGTWLKETAADQIPNVGLMLASGGLGGAVGKAVLGRLIPQYAARATAANLAARGMAAGATKEAAEAAALRAAPGVLGRNIGASTGLYGSIGGIESGGAYSTDVEKHGVEGTSPLLDLGVGVANAAVERILGMEGSILRNVLGHPVKDVTEKAARGILARGLSAGVLSGTKEGMAEAIQETTQLLNERIQDEDFSGITSEETSRLLNSFAAGAALGAPMGAINSSAAARNKRINAQIDQYKDQVFNPLMDEANNIPTDISGKSPAQIIPNQTPVDILNEQAATLRDFFRSTEQSINTQYESIVSRLKNSVDQTQQQVATLMSNSANQLGMTEDQHQQALKQSQQQLLRRQATLASMLEKRKEDIKKLNDMEMARRKKLANNVLSDATMLNQQRLAKDPFTYTTLQNIGQDAKVFSTRQGRLMRSHLDTVRQTAIDIQNKLSNPDARLSPNEVQLLRKQLKATNKAQLELTGSLRKLSKLADTINKRTSDPKSMYTSVSEAKADFEALQSLAYADNAPVDITAPIVDEAAKQEKEARNALEKRLAEIRKRRQEALDKAPVYSDTVKQPKTVREGVWPGDERILNQSNFGALPTIEAQDNVGLQDLNEDIRNRMQRRYRTKRLANQALEGMGELPAIELITQESLAASEAFGVAEPQARLGRMELNRQGVSPAMLAQEPLSIEEKATQREDIANAVPKTKSKPTFLTVLSREELMSRFQQARNQAQESALPFNQGTYDSINKAVESFTTKFPGLKGKISTSWLPTNGHQTDLGYIGTDGSIILIASNIKKYADSTKQSLNKIADAVIKHEGFGHYGLRTVLDSRGFNKFLDDVISNFAGTSTWQSFEQARQDLPQLTPRQKAEEFCAYLAERSQFGDLGASSKPIWSKLKAFVKGILDKLSIKTPETVFDKKKKSFTEEDLINILRSGARSLQQDIDTQVELDSEMSMATSVHGGVTPRTRQAMEEADRTLLGKDLDALKDPDLIRDFREEFLEKVVDANRPIQRLVEELKSRGPNEQGESRVDVNSNIYKILQALPNQTAVKLAQYKKLYVDPITQLIGDLNNTDTAAVKFAKVSDYLEALSALERNAHQRKQKSYRPGDAPISGISDAKAQATIEQLRTPDMDRIVEKVQELHEARLKLMSENKMLGPDTDIILNNWRQAYSNYMPFKSWEDIVQEAAPNWYKSDTRKNLSTPNVQKKLAQRATGREGQAQNPIAHSVMQLYDVVYLADKINAGRGLLNLAERNPDAVDVLEKVEFRKPGKANLDDWMGLKKVVNKKTGEIEFKKTKSTAEGEMADTIAVIDSDGNTQRVWIHDKAALRALKGENIVQATGLIKTIGSLQHTLGKYITSRNPLFWLRNPLRDAVTASINMQSVAEELQGLGVPSPSSIARALITKGLLNSFNKSSVRGALLEYYRSGKTDFSKFNPETQAYMSDLNAFLAYGGQTEYFGTNTYDAIKKDLVSAIATANPRTKAEKGRAIVNKIGEYMDHVSDSLENMTRYIAFKEMVDSIKSSNEPAGPGVWRRPDGRLISEHEIYTRAANVALNLTVNFSRKGSWAPIFNSLYMFASASIGGNVRMLETIFAKDPNTGKVDMRNAFKFAAYPLAAYGVQAMIARALMPEDDDGINTYDKIPDYIKDSNLIIPSPTMDGKYLTIPLPYGFNIFWTMARGILDSAYGAATGTPSPSPMKAVTDTLSSAIDNFAPFGQTSEGLTMFIPSVLRPIYQLVVNKNFAGNPIVPEGNSYARGDVPNSQKYWSTTNETVKQLCKLINEATFGNEVKSGYVDVSPQVLEHLANSYLGGLGRIFFGMLGRLDDLARGKPLDLGKLPGSNVFLRTSQDSDTSMIFSKLRTEAMNQINAVKNARTSTTMSSREKLDAIRENASGAKLQSILNRVQTSLNNIRKYERQIDSSKLSVEEKTRRLESLKARKKQLMMQFNKAAIAAGITEL